MSTGIRPAANEALDTADILLDAIARLGRSMRKGFRGVNRRIDRLTSLTLLANQQRRKDHDRLEARVARLEPRVDRLERRR